MYALLYVNGCGPVTTSSNYCCSEWNLTGILEDYATQRQFIRNWSSSQRWANKNVPASKEWMHVQQEQLLFQETSVKLSNFRRSLRKSKTIKWRPRPSIRPSSAIYYQRLNRFGALHEARYRCSSKHLPSKREFRKNSHTKSYFI